jgi:uncharacterized protein (DUF952 family)
VKPILHITSQAAWLEARDKGEYTAPSLTSEGFVHCSTAAQVLPVAEKFYKGQTGLVLLVIDPARLAADLKWEAPFAGAPPPGVPAGEAFPHIYGPINLDAIVRVLDFEPASDGRFVLPSLI